MSYLGKSPSQGVRSRFYYTATGGQTTFSGADDNGLTLAYADAKYTDVYLNGVLLVSGTDYTATTGTSITLTTGAAASDNIEILTYEISSMANVVPADVGGTFEGNVNFGTGIDVTGTVTADAITMSSAEPVISLTDTNTGVDHSVSGSSSNGGLIINADINNEGTSGRLQINVAGSQAMRIADGGDISFYEDTGTTPKLFWDASAESLGIGTSSPSVKAHIKSDSNNLTVNTLGLSPSTTDNVQGGLGVIAGGYVSLNSANGTVFNTSSTERMRISLSGNVGIGTSSPSALLDIAGSDATFEINSTSGTINVFKGQFSGVERASLVVNGSGDVVESYGIAGNNYSKRLVLNGSERMRIDSSGNLMVGTTDFNLTDNTTGGGVVAQPIGALTAARSAATPLYVNRTGSSDGTLVEFRKDGNIEGTISVSGSTVSYNGGHLARWSQLTDNTRDESIVKGTVMTNLDAMAEWGDEDNEQLNKMAVSSVEGDASVAGVFVNWDNDDDIYTNDMNIAMTGDMVIRIAQGTTVERGDLLMSAGDGTAKPQGDDIVRSKTIAKVTSTHVSHTYDDGSYLVPCVLMAC